MTSPSAEAQSIAIFSPKNVPAGYARGHFTIICRLYSCLCIGCDCFDENAVKGLSFTALSFDSVSVDGKQSCRSLRLHQLDVDRDLRHLHNIQATSI